MKRVSDIKPPQIVSASEAPVKEVVLRNKDINLGFLPVLKHAELNSGKYMTINPCICQDPCTWISNPGVYRHKVKGRDELSALISPANHEAIQPNIIPVTLN